jgi:hypothetical protein
MRESFAAHVQTFRLRVSSVVIWFSEKQKSEEQQKKTENKAEKRFQGSD